MTHGLTRRRLIAGAVGACTVMPFANAAVLGQQSQPSSCFFPRLGITKSEFMEGACLSSPTQIDGYLSAQLEGLSQPQQLYVRFESDRVSSIEYRLKSDEIPDGLPLKRAQQYFNKFMPTGVQSSPSYAMSIGLTTKDAGYAAAVGHSDNLAATNGRSGYYLSLFSCNTVGMPVRNTWQADDIIVGTLFQTVETAEAYPYRAKADNGSPRLGASVEEWTSYYGEGTSGENPTTVFTQIPGSPHIKGYPLMQGDSVTVEAAAYDLDLNTAIAFASAVMPADAVLESTFLLHPSPGAPWSFRVQQWISPNGSGPTMVMFIYRGVEGRANLDAAIVSHGTGIIDWNPVPRG